MNPTMHTPAQPDVALDVLATEFVRRDLDDLDRRSTEELVDTLVEGQNAAQNAVMEAVPAIAAAADAIAARLMQGGRLFYVGAGTSGRLAILDASECPPTFNTPAELVVALIAGGPAAVQEAVEGAEDDVEAGAAELQAKGLKSNDAVVGITASGRTPYVLGALRYAREGGSYTAAIVNNARSPLADVADNMIELLTGPEVIAGSTRLCAGTAQKNCAEHIVDRGDGAARQDLWTVHGRCARDQCQTAPAGVADGPADHRRGRGCQHHGARSDTGQGEARSRDAARWLRCGRSRAQARRGWRPGA